MILLDIGNTHTRIACSNGAEIRLLRRLPTAELSPELIPEGEAAAASVCPWAAERLRGRGINFIGARTCCSRVDFSQVDASTLGADRVANAVAAAEFHPLPALVIDCGSAISCELVDAERRFLGGAIAPGRRLMRMALCSGTAQLPEVALSRSRPERPGCNTAEAIQLGVDAGAVGLIRELYGVLSRGIGLASVILAGGDRDFFAAYFPEWTVAPPEFTLQGVRLAAGG